VILNKTHNEHAKQRTLTGSQRRLRQAWWVGFASIVYFAATVYASANDPIRRDEPFVLWLVRDFPADQIFNAMRAGADSLPPGYYLLLKAITAITGVSLLSLRLPSIVGYYVFAGSIYWIVRSRLGNSIALLSAAVVCLTASYDFATLARPYTLMAASFAAATVLWLECLHGRESLLKQVGIALVLMAGVFVHFYAVLSAVAVGVMEILWSIKHRRFRWIMLLMIAIGGAFVLVWWPVIGSTYNLTQKGVTAPGFYAKPSTFRLIEQYLELIATPRFIVVSLIVAIVAPLTPFFWRTHDELEGYPKNDSATRWDLKVVTAAALLLPVITHLFALVVTHSFNLRYFIGATLGTGVGGALIAHRVRLGNRAAGRLIGLVGLVFIGWASAGVPDNRRAVVAQAPEALPILVSEIGDFFLLFESSPPALRQRLVYATVPEPLGEFNPEAQIVADNWHRLKPELPIVSAADFFAQNSRFYLLQTPGHFEPTLTWLRSHGGLTVAKEQGRAQLLLADAEGQASRREIEELDPSTR
jgi:Dolichyl-phosphate-mannose-protein mannosyltransferase